MKLTVPQIHMMSHAARANYDKMQERIEQDRKWDEKMKELNSRDPIMPNGKRHSEMTMDELLGQIGQG